MLSGVSPVANDDKYAVSAGGTVSQSASAAEVQTLNTLSISGSSGEKPQSKVWNHNGEWYTVFSASGGTYVWRLDGTTWTRGLQLSTSKANADVKQVGDIAHVLLHGSGVQLQSIEFNSATSTYQLWSQRSSLVTIPSSSSETATLDIDSTGRMWVAYEQSGSIIARYSDGDYSNWSSGITLATGINSDDIAAVVALPGQIGVFWSNQSVKHFGFRTHNDGDPPTVWAADENPAGQYPQSSGAFSDDHINLEVKADGTLYAAVKTSFNSSGKPALILLVRRPNGVWDPPYSIDDSGTRPTIAARANTGDLIYAYRNTNGSGPIIYRELYDNGTTISFIGPEKTLINGGSYNDVSSAKDPFGDDIVLVAAGGGKLGATRITFSSGVLSNDTDAERNTLIASLVQGPQHGQLALNSDGSFTYTHNGDNAASDSFTYRAFDGTSFSNVATVQISIAQPNTPPIVVNDTYSIAHGASLNANDATGTVGGPENNGVLANDSDPQGNPLTAILVSNPAHGTVSLNPNGTFTYTHNGDNATSDTFTYRASDGSLQSGIATVTITIAAAPPGPATTNNPPTAVNDSYSIAHGATLNANDANGTLGGPENNGVLANDSDPENNPLTAILVTPPQHGSATLNANGTFTYTHNGDNATSDSFTYRASDGSLQSGLATVNIGIAAPVITDQPVTVSFQDGVDGYSGTTDATIKGKGATTNYGAATTLELDGSPDVASLIRWNVSTIPTSSLVQSASITLYITNASSQAYEIYEMLKPWTESTVTWNQAATGSNWSTAGAQGSADHGSSVLGTLSGSTGSVTITLGAAGVAMVQKWINDPSSNNGIIIQEYINSNGLDFNSREFGTVDRRPQLAITYAVSGSSNTPDSQPNTPPVAANDSYSIAHGATLVANDPNGTLGGPENNGVLANDSDADADSLTATVVSNPTHGSLTLNPNGTFTYTHNGDPATSDTFTYRASDGEDDSPLATVTITIAPPATPANNPPVAVNDSYSIAHAATLNANDPNGTLGGPENNGVLANDSDPNGNSLAAILVSNPTHGSLTLNANGTFTYTHNGDTATSDSFTYRASDGSLQSGLTTVNIAIAPPVVTNAPVTASFQDGVNGYDGTADTRIQAGRNADTNYGSATTIGVDGSPDVASLIRWNVSTIPTSSLVQSASITLYITNSSSQAYEIYEMLKPWTESTVTWNQTGAGSNWSTAGAQGSADHGSSVLGTLSGSTGSVTITLGAAGVAMVQKWINDPSSNNGIIIQEYINSNGLDFNSREYATVSRRPQLTITYAPASPLVADSIGPFTAGTTADGEIELAGLAEEAQTRLFAMGAPNPDAVRSALQAVQFRWADLDGNLLALAAGNKILLDRDAAGFGWFVDGTPGDEEFDSTGRAAPESAADGKMDLLSVIAHEYGHVLGLGHEEGGVMDETLSAGQRTVIDRAALDLFFESMSSSNDLTPFEG